MVVLALQQVNAGSILRTFYDEIPGTSIDDVRDAMAFDDAGGIFGDLVSTYPIFSSDLILPEYLVDGFDTIRGSGDNYVSAVRGWIQAPMDGAFIFFIASDNASELYIREGTNCQWHLCLPQLFH